MEFISSLTWSEILPVIGPTGLVAMFLIWKFFTDKRKENAPTNFTEAQTAFNAQILKRLDKLEDENRRLMEENASLRLQVAQLRRDFDLMESAHHDLPIPQWMKDTNGVMLSLNKAYEELFLLPMGLNRHDYVGNTDEEVWGVDIANRFRQIDSDVLHTGRPFNGTVIIPYRGEEKEFHIIKYPRFVGGSAVGVAGLAIPDVDEILSVYL